MMFSQSVRDHDYASPVLDSKGVARIRKFGNKGVRGFIRACMTDPLSQKELDRRLDFVLHARLP